MRKLLLLTVILVAVATVASATPVACAGATNLLALIATNAGGGCYSQGVTFSDFSYTGGGSKTADLVLATLVIQDAPGVNGDGWSFGPTGGWTVGFTIGFTVSITPTPISAGYSIIQTVDQIFAGRVGPSNTVVATDTESLGITPNPMTLNALSLAGETAQSDVYSLNSVTTNTVVTDAATGLSNYEQVFYNTAIPEPVTFILIGSGLIGLTFLRRRIRKS